MLPSLVIDSPVSIANRIVTRVRKWGPGVFVYSHVKSAIWLNNERATIGPIRILKKRTIP